MKQAIIGFMNRLIEFKIAWLIRSLNVVVRTLSHYAIVLSLRNKYVVMNFEGEMQKGVICREKKVAHDWNLKNTANISRRLMKNT